MVGQVNAGLHTTAQRCREHSLAPSLIHRWRKEVKDRGEAAFTDGAKMNRSAELHTLELERYRGQPALENLILKKSLATYPLKKGTSSDHGCALRSPPIPLGAPPNLTTGQRCAETTGTRQCIGIYLGFTGRPDTALMVTPLVSSVRQLRPAALLRLLLGVLLPLIVVGALGEDVLERQRFAFESPFMLCLHAHSTPALDHFAVALAYVGGYQVIAPVSAVLAVVFWRRSPDVARFFTAAVLGAALLNSVMKFVFHRPRPELWPRLLPENGASFPSGHSMYSAAFVTALILLAWPTRFRWPVLLLGVLFTLIVGWSRIDLGVHYPTDVLAGWLTGAAWVLGTYSLLRPRPVPLPSVQNEADGQEG